jgi:ketosteroid isomerase-like protein
VDLERVIDRYHEAASEFAKGRPDGIKALWSQADDVTLANPFGPAVVGWPRVAEALDFASGRFRDGDVTDVETLASYVSSDLASVLEIERWRSRVGGREEVEAFELRVTTTFRRADGQWKIVHRHADPIATADPDGPLRSA